MTLRRKLLSVFGSLALIAMVVVGVTFWITARWDETSRQMSAHYQRSLLLQRVRVATFQAIKEVSDAVFMGDADALGEFRQALAPAEEDLAAWARLADTQEERREVEEVRAAFRQLVGNAGEALALAARGERDAAAQMMENQVERTDYALFQQVSERGVERDRARREDVRAAVRDVQDTAFVILLIAAFGIVSLVLLLAAYLASDLFRPLRSVERALDEVGHGNLKARIDESRDDEIGRIYGAFNRMATALQRREELMGRVIDRRSAHASEDGDETASGWSETPSRVTLHALVAQLQARVASLHSGDGDAGERQAETLRQVEALLSAVSRLTEIGFPLDLNLARSDVRALVYDALTRFQGELVRLGVSTEVLLDPAIDHVVLDRLKLREAISETIRNALAALPESGGQLGVRTVRDQDGLFAIEIADNGRGIDPDLLARILNTDPFRADAPVKTGLALTKAVAEQHGGRLEVLSRVGQGTVVRIELPQRA